MNRDFIYHLLLYIGIKYPEDYIDSISKETMDALIAKLTIEEINEILEEIKKTKDKNDCQ